MLQRLVAEAMGAFAIVFFGCGAAITLQNHAEVHFLVSLAFGLVVAASVVALGHISAAHFNPAVTLAFAGTRRFPWKSVPAYIGAQIAGASLASLVHALLFPTEARTILFAATVPKTDLVRTVAVEGLLTFFLMLVIMAVATDKRVPAALPGPVIGITVGLCALVGGPVTGASMNPARSIGPALFAGGVPLASLWIYFVGPIVGAFLAALLYESIRGDVGQPSGTHA